MLQVTDYNIIATTQEMTILYDGIGNDQVTYTHYNWS